MKNKSIIGIIISVILIILINIWPKNNEPYSQDITYNEAIIMINDVKNTDYSDNTDAWNIQKIDNNLYLISYSNTPVQDVFKSKHSWILSNTKVVYEVFDGMIVRGTDLELKIASKFSHNIKTERTEIIMEDIPYEEEFQISDRVEANQSIIHILGSQGKKEIEIITKYTDGKEASKEMIETILIKPINQITLIGKDNKDKDEKMN